jgi:hypothetical protein
MILALCRLKKIVMTNNVLPLHFAPSQASSSQNSNVDSYLQYYEVDSLKSSKSESSSISYFFTHVSRKVLLFCLIWDKNARFGKKTTDSSELIL